MYNVQTPAEFGSGRVRYVDLEIDVSCRPGPPPRVTIHDAAELDRSTARGYIPPDLAAMARHLADRLDHVLAETPDPEAPQWDIDPMLEAPLSGNLTPEILGESAH